ncbi:MAG: hypothetical protein ACU0CO_07915 [Shimia sp.]
MTKDELKPAIEAAGLAGALVVVLSLTPLAPLLLFFWAPFFALVFLPGGILLAQARADAAPDVAPMRMAHWAATLGAVTTATALLGTDPWSFLGL